MRRRGSYEKQICKETYIDVFYVLPSDFVCADSDFCS